MTFILLGKEDLTANLEQGADFWVPHLIPKEGITVIYGPPKVGKSTVCLDLAMGLQNGVPFGGHEAFRLDEEPSPTVQTAWVSFEDGGKGEFTERAGRWPKHYQWPHLVQEERNGVRGTPWSLSFNPLLSGTNDHRVAQAAWGELGAFLHNRAEGEPTVLFVDPLAGLLSVEGKSDEVQSAIKTLSDLRTRHDVHVVLIGHSSEHEDSFGKKKDKIMGPTAWTSGVRHTVFVGGNTSQTWCQVKGSNRGEDGINIQLAKVDGGPVTVTKITSVREYVQEKKASTQQRKWEDTRLQALKAYYAGADAWRTETTIGEAVGGSRSMGRKIILQGFFKKGLDGGYEPVLDKIRPEDPPV